MTYERIHSAPVDYMITRWFWNGSVEEELRFLKVSPYLVLCGGLDPSDDPDEPRILEFLSYNFSLFIIL